MILDKYDSNELNRILEYFSLKKPSDFVFPDQIRKFLPGIDVYKIEQMLKDISKFDETILKDLGENNMYHHQFKKGPFLDEFLRSGGFHTIVNYVDTARKKVAEMEKLKIENLEAGPEAVRVAAEANRLAYEANKIARENKKSSIWNTIIAGLAFLISIIALLRTFNII